MHLCRLHLYNFRNYRDAQVYPGKGLNFVLGDNAQGKSNLLESIAYLSFGRSPRGVHDRHLLCWDAPLFKIEAELQGTRGGLSLQFVYEREKEKTINVNGVAQSKLSEAIGLVQAVWFSPEHLALVQGPPAGRRNFLDLHIYQVNPRFRALIKQYRQIVMQRNHLLRQSRSSVAATYQLEVWEEQLIEVGSRILAARWETLREMKDIAAESHSTFSGGKENLTISYLSTLGVNEEERDLRAIKSLFASRMEESRQQDLSQGATSVGPHRDDLLFSLNGADARIFSSQGQQRTIALSLKMSEMELIKRATGEYPLLLFDDVLSELDLHRRKQLLRDISSKVQCFVSASAREGIPTTALEQAHIIEVKEGTLTTAVPREQIKNKITED